MNFRSNWTHEEHVMGLKAPDLILNGFCGLIIFLIKLQFLSFTLSSYLLMFGQFALFNSKYKFDQITSNHMELLFQQFIASLFHGILQSLPLPLSFTPFSSFPPVLENECSSSLYLVWLYCINPFLSLSYTSPAVPVHMFLLRATFKRKKHIFVSDNVVLVFCWRLFGVHALVFMAVWWVFTVYIHTRVAAMKIKWLHVRYNAKEWMPFSSNRVHHLMNNFTSSVYQAITNTATCDVCPMCVQL